MIFTIAVVLNLRRGLFFYGLRRSECLERSESGKKSGRSIVSRQTMPTAKAGTPLRAAVEAT